jgi:hypothetical protein
MCKPNKVGAGPKFDKPELYERREAEREIRQRMIDEYHRQFESSSQNGT